MKTQRQIRKNKARKKKTQKQIQRHKDKDTKTKPQRQSHKYKATGTKAKFNVSQMLHCLFAPLNSWFRLNSWFKANKMTLNTDRTSFILFKSKYHAMQDVDTLLKIDRIWLHFVSDNP